MSIQENNSALSTEFPPDTHTTTEFVCACEENMRSACTGEGFFREHKGRRYCVLHYPGQEKVTAFNSALQKKLEAKDFNFRGVWFPNVSFEDFQFSLNADFGRAVFTADADFSNTSFYKDVNFRSAKFTASADFSGATFSAIASFFKASFTADMGLETADVSFIHAKFKGPADFKFSVFNVEAYFLEAEYEAVADFNKAMFKNSVSFGATKFGANAIFSSAEFRGEALFFSANFSAATKFQETNFNSRADFSNATFSADADFSSTTFAAEVDFKHSSFSSYVRFTGNKTHHVFGDHSYLNLQHVRIEKPERISFHALKLSPHWFVNVDARKFEFVGVEWSKGRRREIASLLRQVDSSPHHLLSIAYRQLAINAEENHRYREASEFRYWSMNMQRLELLSGESILLRYLGVVKKSTRRVYQSLMRKPGKSVSGRTLIRSWRFLSTYWKSLQVLHWLYWAASGYGERVTRAIVALIALWLLFACAFCLTGFELKPTPTTTAANVISDEVGRPLPITKALTYSLGVMSLQKPEPRPVTTTAQTLVTLETIFGPLQAALLALAIRRKFMR